MAFVLQEKENIVQLETFIRLHCPSPNCEKIYKTKKSLNEHFRLYPTHKPESLKNSHKRISTKEISVTFLNGEQPYSRRQRVRELMSHLTDEEISEFALPRVTKVVPPVDFFYKEAPPLGMYFRSWSLLESKFVSVFRNL